MGLHTLGAESKEGGGMDVCMCVWEDQSTQEWAVGRRCYLQHGAV